MNKAFELFTKLIKDILGVVDETKTTTKNLKIERKKEKFRGKKNEEKKLKKLKKVEK